MSGKAYVGITLPALAMVALMAESAAGPGTTLNMIYSGTRQAKTADASQNDRKDQDQLKPMCKT